MDDTTSLELVPLSVLQHALLSLSALPQMPVHSPPSPVPVPV
ncbi:hypothetical protein EW145_g4143, partial [Phellinidium pouzarii]